MNPNNPVWVMSMAFPQQDLSGKEAITKETAVVKSFEATVENPAPQLWPLSEHGYRYDPSQVKPYKIGAKKILQW
jgi:hypothetical protein